MVIYLLFILVIPFKDDHFEIAVPAENLSVDSLHVPNSIPDKEDSRIVVNGPSFQAAHSLKRASVESRERNAKFLLKSALLRKLTYQYVTTLVITAMALMPNVIATFFLLREASNLSLQNEYASERMAYLTQVSLLIREVDVFASGSSR
jgi:hypothetical protein